MSIRISLFLVCVLLLSIFPVAAQTPDTSILDGEIYTLDAAHSLFDFTVRHLGFARVRGTFKDYRSAIYYVEKDMAKSSVTVLIDVDSIDTQSGSRDHDLKEEKFFHTEKFRWARFHSRTVEQTREGFVAVGPLTIRDITREVRIPFRVISRRVSDQFENARITFEGSLTVSRKDYGVVGPDFWNNMISDEVRIEIDLAATVFNYNNPFSRWQENSIGKVAEETVEKEGVEAARQKIRRLWRDKKEEFDFSLGQLLRAAMKLTQRGRHRDAIGIFMLAVELHKDLAEPADLAEVFTALSEVHARVGDRATARESAEKALDLDPNNVAAAELIRHLVN